MRMDLTVRGMRDYYPDVYNRLSYIFRAWRETAVSYGFEEFDGPVIETLDLYKIKSGEEIVKQLYNFFDKGGRELALRPELTPSLARMVSKVQNQISKPMKWFSIPRCMRYEKPQKGRLREFFQFNVDILGEDNEMADLEVISVAIDSLIRLGLGSNDFVVKINNRNFVSEFFAELGIDKVSTGALYKIIDNARKLQKKMTMMQMDELGLTAKQKAGLEMYLNLERAEELERLKGENSGRESLLRLFSLIKIAGVQDYCEFDTAIVRGLDYYTGTVFEIFDRSEKMRAVCGGGRYNNLLKEISGVEIPACGFGMGDVVLGEILSDKGIFPEYQRQIEYFLVRVSDNELELLLKVARSLRLRGFSVEYTYRLIPVKKQMARASRIPAKRVLIFGADEIAQGRLVEKDLSTGIETQVEIQSYLQ
jgi:histidyl-tRNA synthetase